MEARTRVLRMAHCESPAHSTPEVHTVDPNITQDTAESISVSTRAADTSNGHRVQALRRGPAIPITRTHRGRSHTVAERRTSADNRLGLRGTNTQQQKPENDVSTHVQIHPQLEARNDVPETWVAQLKEIFCMRTPILRHIPARARGFVLRSYTSCVWDVVRATRETSRERAFPRLFMFAHCVLLATPKKTARHLRSSIIDVIRGRVQNW